MIDGGPGDTLLNFLSHRGIRRIDSVLVSHADADHFGGISLLLSDPRYRVGHVYLNPDSRRTVLWDDFVSVMRAAQQRGTRFSLELSSGNPGQLSVGASRLEVLAPSQQFAVRTTSGQTPGGQRLTPNAMSAVVRVWTGDSPRLLIAGDIDKVGLDQLVAHAEDARAEVLVFPHHGGLPRRADPRDFAESLMRLVGAHLVVFSIGRARYRTPDPNIVSAILDAVPDVHIACTQLSRHCASERPQERSSLHAGISRGAEARACCAGTMEVTLEPENGYWPTRQAHLDFIRLNAPTALCRRSRVPTTGST